MIVESWTNLGTCEWSHQHAWQAATTDTVLPDRFTLHQNTTTAFETIRSLGYPSEHGYDWANKLNNRTVQPWPRIPLMDRLKYSFNPPVRPPTPIRLSRAPAPSDTLLQWSLPNYPALIPPTLPSSLPPPSALPSEISTSQAPVPRTTTPPPTASHTCPTPTSPESVSTGPAPSALISAPISPISTPSQANSSLELVDDQASQSAVDLSPESRTPGTNKPERVSRRQIFRNRWHKVWRKIIANVSRPVCQHAQS